MQVETPKIEIYRTRTFTDKLSDTFSFIRENWRPFLKYFVYLMLPVSIVVALPFNHFFEGYFKMLTITQQSGGLDDSSLIWYGLSLVATFAGFFVAYVVLMGLVYSLIRLYAARPLRLNALSFDELKPELVHCMKRCAILSAVSTLLLIAVLVVFVLVFGLTFLAGYEAGLIFTLIGVVVFYIALIALIPPMYLVVPIYMMEDETGVLQAYRKAFRLGFATWGGVFAVCFVVGILSSVIESVTMAPWYIMSLVKMVFTLSHDGDASFFGSFIYTSLLYLTSIVTCLGYLLSMAILSIGVTMQYGHACDKIDGVGVSRKIDRFDEFDNF